MDGRGGVGLPGFIVPGERDIAVIDRIGRMIGVDHTMKGCAIPAFARHGVVDSCPVGRSFGRSASLYRGPILCRRVYVYRFAVIVCYPGCVVESRFQNL